MSYTGNLITENNSVDELDLALTSGQTVLTVKDISNMPSIVNPDDFAVFTLIRKSDGAIEYVKATAQDAGQRQYTIERAQETTTALDFVAGDIIANRLTREQIELLKGDRATGTVPVNVNSVVDLAGAFTLDLSHNSRSLNHDGLAGFTIPDLGKGFQCVYHNNSNGTVAITLDVGVTNNNASSLTVLAYGSIGIEFLADGDVWLNGNLEVPA